MEKETEKTLDESPGRKVDKSQTDVQFICTDPRPCPKCNEIFQHESKYTDHVLTHSPWYVMYVCGVCGVSVDQKNLLATHIISHFKLTESSGLIEESDAESNPDSEDLPLVPPEDPAGQFACNKCPASYNKQYFLKEHAKGHDIKTELIEKDRRLLKKRSAKLIMDVVADDSGNDDINFSDDDYLPDLDDYSAPVKSNHPKGEKRPEKTTKERNSYKCEFCDMVFERKALLRSHENDTHKEECANRSQMVRCEICNLLCKKNSYKGHMRIHTGEKPFQCSLCGKSFTHQGSLSQHKKVHSEKGYSCKICNKAYSRATHLKAHMWVHSGQKSYICSTCGKTFAQSCTLKVHMKLHSGEKPYSCTVCGKAFSKQWGLVAHNVVHSREKRFVCEKCGEEFARKVSLKFHILKWHTDGNSALLVKNHICDTCGKAFFTKAELQQHLIVHSGLKPFICGICGKTFARQSGLVLHTRTHTGEKPYVCKVCNKAFACKSTLNTHRVIHTGEKPYSCQTCGKAFKFRVTLSEHIQLHSGEKPFTCALCGKEFALSKYLQAHMSKHKEEKPHICQMCNRAYYSENDLQKHCETFHA